MNGGLVARDALERKTDTNLDPEEHLFVKKNDIAYNMMRMWQGALGLAGC
jgi:type I restriction enzyme S subunit